MESLWVGGQRAAAGRTSPGYQLTNGLRATPNLATMGLQKSHVLEQLHNNNVSKADPGRGSKRIWPPSAPFGLP